MKSFALLLFPLFLAGSLAAKEVYVDNANGNDNAPGTKTSPVRTIRHAMELLASGDTLHLTPNPQPYTEPIHFSGRNRHLAGNPGRPTIVDGHGARFSGLRHRTASEWTKTGRDIYTLQLNNNAWVMDRQGYWSGFPIVFADGKPLPWKKSKSELVPNSYVLTKVFGAKKTPEHNKLHVRLEPGKTPADVKLETPHGDYAVCVEGADNVTIRNIKAEYYPGDGFDSAWRKVVFEGVEGRRNMDQGISAHASELVVRNSRFHGNAGGGIVDVGMASEGRTRRSNVRYIDCIIEDDVFRNDDLLALADRESPLENQFIIFLVCKNRLDFECARKFLPDENTADCRRYDRFRAESFHSFRESPAEFFRNIRIFEQKRRLKEFVAVQFAAENEMTVEKRPDVLKCFDDFLICHDSDDPYYKMLELTECIGGGRLDPDMEVNFLISDVQGDHGIQAGQEQSIGNLDFTGGNRNRDIAVSENRLGIAESENQIFKLVEFCLQRSVECIGTMAFRAEHLKIIRRKLHQIKFDNTVTLWFHANKVQLRLACIDFVLIRHDYNFPYFFLELWSIRHSLKTCCRNNIEL